MLWFAIIALQNVCYSSTYFNAKSTSHPFYSTKQKCDELMLDVYLVGRLLLKCYSNLLT